MFKANLEVRTERCVPSLNIYEPNFPRIGTPRNILGCVARKIVQSDEVRHDLVWVLELETVGGNA